MRAVLSEQVFEPLVYRYAIAVGQLVGLVGHADDGDEFAEHLLGHAEPLRRRAVRMGAVLTGIGDADREIHKLLGQRVERTRRHYLLEALPGAPQSRRVVRQGLPEIVDPIGVACPLDVVEHGTHLGAGRILVDQRHRRHCYLPMLWRLSSPASRPVKNSPSMRKSLTSDQAG